MNPADQAIHNIGVIAQEKNLPDLAKNFVGNLMKAEALKAKIDAIQQACRKANFALFEARNRNEITSVECYQKSHENILAKEAALMALGVKL